MVALERHLGPSPIEQDSPSTQIIRDLVAQMPLPSLMDETFITQEARSDLAIWRNFYLGLRDNPDNFHIRTQENLPGMYVLHLIPNFSNEASNYTRGAIMFTRPDNPEFALRQAILFTVDREVAPSILEQQAGVMLRYRFPRPGDVRFYTALGEEHITRPEYGGDDFAKVYETLVALYRAAQETSLSADIQQYSRALTVYKKTPQEIHLDILHMIDSAAVAEGDIWQPENEKLAEAIVRLRKGIALISTPIDRDGNQLGDSTIDTVAENYQQMRSVLEAHKMSFLLNQLFAANLQATRDIVSQNFRVPNSTTHRKFSFLMRNTSLRRSTPLSAESRSLLEDVLHSGGFYEELIPMFLDEVFQAEEIAQQVSTRTNEHLSDVASRVRGQLGEELFATVRKMATSLTLFETRVDARGVQIDATRLIGVEYTYEALRDVLIRDRLGQIKETVKDYSRTHDSFTFFELQNPGSEERWRYEFIKRNSATRRRQSLSQEALFVLRQFLVANHVDERDISEFLNEIFTQETPEE